MKTVILFTATLIVWLSFGFYACRRSNTSITVTNSVNTNRFVVAPSQTMTLEFKQSLTSSVVEVRAMTDRELLSMLRRLNERQLLSAAELRALTNLERDVERSTISVSNSSGTVIYVEIPTDHDRENFKLQHK